LERITPAGILSTGFVITGNSAEQLLIRASGPTLGAPPFNLLGTIPDPKLTVFDSSSNIIATNAGWLGNSMIKISSLTAGAFQFIGDNSKDSAVILNLQPGSYTVQVSSITDTPGITLIEIYELSK
jgi:hypothetical protein